MDPTINALSVKELRSRLEDVPDYALIYVYVGSRRTMVQAEWPGEHGTVELLSADLNIGGGGAALGSAGPATPGPRHCPNCGERLYRDPATGEHGPYCGQCGAAQ